MTISQIRDGFRAEHHAMLFAWIAKETISQVGRNEASPVLHKAVRRYGEQRGRRMALRAQANGHDLSMLTWLAYPEWKPVKNEMVMKLVQRRPDVRIHIPLCPWYTNWKDNGLLEYGTFYCEEIDKAVVRGFNTDLLIDVNSIKPHGHGVCDMVFHDVDLTPLAMFKFLTRKFIAARKNSIMPWEYHIGHLYKTIGEELMYAFGEKGRIACLNAINIFSKKYGQDATQVVRRYWDTDFDQLAA